MRRDEETLYNLISLSELQEKADFVSSKHNCLSYFLLIDVTICPIYFRFFFVFFLQIDWRGFFEDAMRFVKRKVTPKENVAVYASEYLGNLTILVNEYLNTTDGKM